MHEVPGIVKNSYRPLLNQAIEFAPEAIYVEWVQPTDSLSWDYLQDGWSAFLANFYAFSDSLQQHSSYDEVQVDRLLNDRFGEWTKEEWSTILHAFIYQRDVANYNYYRYIATHGTAGSRQPQRTEYSDLAAPLALAMGIKYLRSMDDQRTNREYHQYVAVCLRDGEENGDDRILRKLYRQDLLGSLLPGLWGRYGIYSNKDKVVARYHEINSYRYVTEETEGCILARRYWDERNRRIAYNLGRQIQEGGEARSVAIIGAGHIVGLEEELQRQFPSIRIIRIND
jgi:hypothetical protein